MTKANRDRRIQTRLNKVTYPLIVKGWEDKKERQKAKQIGLEAAQKMLKAAPLIQKHIMNIMVHGSSSVFIPKEMNHDKEKN